MRTLAIGDIHGCLTALERLLAEVRPQADDLVVTLGDYVDRGPDSRGVIERLLQLGTECQLVALRGNHDFMMLEARRARLDADNWRRDPIRLTDPTYHPRADVPSEEKEWLACGGRQTLVSYSQGGTLRDVPEEHWHFLEQTCVDWYETATHLFVHANAYPDMPLADQPEYMLHWEKMLAPRQHVSGKILICGHTSQRSGLPRNWGHTVCIDTWVYGAAGWLTCLDVDTGQYWQANQSGETNTSMLGLAHY